MRRFLERKVAKADDKHKMHDRALHDALQINDIVHVGIRVRRDGEDMQDDVAP